MGQITKKNKYKQKKNNNAGPQLPQGKQENQKMMRDNGMFWNYNDFKRNPHKGGKNRKCEPLIKVNINKKYGIEKTSKKIQ